MGDQRQQDMLMVQYLATLTKTHMALNERLYATIRDVAAPYYTG
eukprot:NODE_9318_length_229_cov_103.550000_g8703_i0.p1 GENE.NODE_9318_length_229_cov_103.550000_g8703_i0~~NODE_9318_length_229_cov_103.550000_g8703_i0.p1  ORF type:complete len:54 (+),score=23.66 NODE_9318_length_229_cov_103.550000_g8703_i0:33-164(+)